MAIKRTTILGTEIICEIESSNIKRTIYNSESKNLTVEFNSGAEYVYNDVPHNIYAQFRLSESQGKFFNKNISKTYKYKKIEK